MNGRGRLVAVAALLCCVAACRDATDGVVTQFTGAYPFSTAERRVIARVAGDAAREARKYLPGLSARITLRVDPGKKVIRELGAIAEAGPPDYIVWTVDPDYPGGVATIAENHLRAALFHEFHHLVRFTARPGLTPMDRVVAEGMATAFERDFAGANSPWGQYPEEVTSWVGELLKLPTDDDRTEWMSRHPDRRVSYKTGTYLVDLAMKKLNRTSAELVAMPTQEVIDTAIGTTAR